MPPPIPPQQPVMGHFRTRPRSSMTEQNNNPISQNQLQNQPRNQQLPTQSSTPPPATLNSLQRTTLGNLATPQTSAQSQNLASVSQVPQTEADPPTYPPFMLLPPQPYTRFEVATIRDYQRGVYGPLIRMEPNPDGSYTSGRQGYTWWMNRLVYDPPVLPQDPSEIPRRCFLADRIVQYLMDHPGAVRLQGELLWPGDFGD